MVLSDDQRAILAELNADARYTEESLAELAEECETFPELLCEIADADLCEPWDWPVGGDGGGYAGDDEIPW